jgi:RND family efflux transporter MFP subunit
MVLLISSGCSRPDPPPATAKAPEPENRSVTRWSDRTELFMEYPPLVAGVGGRFAVHLTRLNDFKPVAAGQVTVRFRDQGAPDQSFQTPRPSRPGIFGVDVRPERPGKYVMSVELRAPGLEDIHELGEVVVYGSQADIPPEAEKPKEETIAFLKEQQWSLDFATSLAAERDIRESLPVPAEVQPRSGGEAELVATIAGRLAGSPPLPVLGSVVSQGQPLASLTPQTPAPAEKPNLDLAISEAETALALARKDRDRVDRLLAAGAIPARRVDEARAAEATAAARLKAAQARLAQYEASREAEGSGEAASFLLRSPITGVVAEVRASAGSNVVPGDKLFRIVAVDRVYLAAHVPEAEAHRLGQLTAAEIEIAGAGPPLPSGRLVSLSRFVDPETRTLKVIYELENPGRRLAIGQSVTARLFLSSRRRSVAVPEGAVIDDGGRPVVFVQLEGEAFARRPVKLGLRESNYVQVLEGVRPGDRIVTRGAYLIRLAALSTQIPAHGHVH